MRGNGRSVGMVRHSARIGIPPQEYYRVVPLSGANEEVAATEAPAEEIAEPVQEEPAPVAESAEPTSAQEQAETAAEGTEFVAVDESTVVLRRSENLTFEARNSAPGD